MSYNGPLIGQFHYIRDGKPVETLVTTQDPHQSHWLQYRYPSGMSGSISYESWRGLLSHQNGNRWAPAIPLEYQVEEGL